MYNPFSLSLGNVDDLPANTASTFTIEQCDIGDLSSAGCLRQLSVGGVRRVGVRTTGRGIWTKLCGKPASTGITIGVPSITRAKCLTAS